MGALIRRIAATAALALTLAAPAAAGPADLDPSFSGDGKDVIALPGPDRIAGVAIQADGKVLVAASVNQGTTATVNLAVARYTAAGVLDPTYAGDGMQTADFGASESAKAMALQADGKAIVVGGSHNGSSADFLVARYATDGSPDSTFSGDGFVLTDVDPGGNDAAAAVAIQPDGRVVVAGNAGLGFTIARYTAAGALDATFAGDGTTSVFDGAFNGFFPGVAGVAVQADGKILVAGQAYGDFAIARLDANGTPDATFSDDGQQTTDMGGEERIGGLALEPGGKAVVAGTTVSGAGDDADFALVRYDASGGLDPAFAGDGTTTTDFPAANPNADLDVGADVAVQADGAIVIAGSAGGGDPVFGGGLFVYNQVGLARYDAAGVLDPSFSDDGRQTTTIDPATAAGDIGDAVAIQGDGRIVVAATASLGENPVAEPGDIAVLRYGGDAGGQAPTPDVTATPTPATSPTPTTAPPYVIPPRPATVTDVVLACSDRKIVLEDVYPDGSRVRLIGVADRSFAGRKVTIVFTAGGKTVATPTVRADGTFTATAPLPPRKLRNSNRARYQAGIGKLKSLALKLSRRMRITRLTSAAGKVTIAGKVTPPLAKAKKDRKITLERVVNCKRLEKVKTFQPRRSGSFSVTVPVPAGQTAAVYRVRTKVRRTKRSKALGKTFSLPRAVGFG